MNNFFYLFLSGTVVFTTSVFAQSGSLNHFSKIELFEKYNLESYNTKDSTSSNQTDKKFPSIGIGSGILTYQGDLSSSFFNKIKMGYNFSVEQYLTNFLGIAVNGTYGKISANGGVAQNHSNFESKIIQGDLSLFFCLRKKMVSPYIAAGYSFLAFDPYGDLKDGAGNTYYYWTDGSIKNTAQDSPYSTSATDLVKDYKYETKLTDSVTSYKRNTTTIPITAGINIRVLHSFSLRVGASYNIVMSDWIDNYKSGNPNDNYLYTNIAIHYHFGSSRNSEDEASTKITRDDSDGDGITDFDDQCPGTPKGVPVDKFGCLIDIDTDGIPDYKDKEPNSAAGAIVDQNGVTLTPEMIAKREEEKRLLLQGKLQSYIEENQAKFSAATGETTIPENLKMFDLNNDGKISTDEINMSISNFFDGDNNGITTQKINELINYFFEQ